MPARGARFARWYNHQHRHSGIRCVTPAQRQAGQDGQLLCERHALCQAARQRNPRRWSGQTRDWTPVGAATLNPERDISLPDSQGAALMAPGQAGVTRPARHLP